jgi:hypothetical protein
MMRKHHSDGHWSGHLPVTSTALLSILERAARGEARFFEIERRLYLACEVWAAINADDLGSLFESTGVGALRETPAAFSAIGAERVADVLRKVLVRPINGPSPRERIAAIAEELRCISEPVDELIASAAREYLRSAARPCQAAPALRESASG